MGIKVGTDIIDIARVDESLLKFGDKFLNRFLNDSEINIAKKNETIAGFWAAKEAISKALGCGIGKELGFKDIEIKKNNKNMPYFELSGSNFDIIDSSLSISHDGGFATAVVVIVVK
jgi:holo-[acyl-carrier protein] synthase